MPTATINGVVVAESDETVVVEGNHYFPPASVKLEHFRESAHTSVCGWKGTASYFDIDIEGQVSQNVAWYYAEPKDAAAEITGYVAFYPAVTVTA